MKKYQITPEHEIELEKIKQKYIKNAFRTDAMTEYDREQMRVCNVSRIFIACTAPDKR